VLAVAFVDDVVESVCARRLVAISLTTWFSAGRPDEGFGILVVTVDVTADRHDEFFQIAKHAATSLPLERFAMARETQVILRYASPKIR
jgi:hypothetical protein